MVMATITVNPPVPMATRAALSFRARRDRWRFSRGSLKSIWGAATFCWLMTRLPILSDAAKLIGKYDNDVTGVSYFPWQTDHHSPVFHTLAQTTKAGASAPASSQHSGTSLLPISLLCQTQFLQAFLGDRGRQGHIAILHYHFLALLGQHQLGKLSGDRIQGLVRRLVHIDPQETGQGVFTCCRFFRSSIHKRLAFFQRQGHSLHTGRFITDPGVADRVQGFRYTLYYRSGTGLLIDVVFEVTLTQSGFLEVAIGAVDGVATKRLSAAIGRATLESQLAPGFYIFAIAALASAGANGIQLSHGQCLDGVVLVDEDRQSVNGHRNRRGLIAELLLEFLDFLVLHFPAHGAEVRRAFRQGGRCCRRSCCLHLDIHVRIMTLELLGPQGHQVRQGIGTHTGNTAGHTTGPFIHSQCRIHLGLRHRNRCGRRQGECCKNLLYFHLSNSPEFYWQTVWAINRTRRLKGQWFCLRRISAGPVIATIDRGHDNFMTIKRLVFAAAHPP